MEEAGKAHSSDLESAKIRYSFVGQPILNMSIEPKIGVSQFDITAIPQVSNVKT